MWLLVVWIIWIVAFGSLCGWLAGEKGRSAFNWFCLGAVFGLVALLVLGFAPVMAEPEPVRRERDGSRYRKGTRYEQLVTCPSCRSVVTPAVSCSSCGEPLAPGPRRPQIEEGPAWRDPS
jgi:hypothetical protein